MMAAFKDTMTELLGSKKFLLFLATLIAAGAAKVGWNISTDAIMPYLGLAATTILAQGIADHGKGAAEVIARTQAAAMSATLAKPSAPPPVPKQAGFVAPRLLAIMAASTIAVFGVFNGCSWFSSEAKSAGDALIDCAKQDVGATVSEIGLTILADVASILEAGATGWQASLDQLAQKYGTDLVSCAAKDVLTVLTAPSTNSLAREISPGADRAKEYLTGKRFK